MIFPDWFNASPRFVKVRGVNVRLWNLFNRNFVEGHWWGVGVLQIGSRHLFYVGHDRVYIGFLPIWEKERV